MVRKKNFWFFVKYYNLLFYMAFAIFLILFKDYAIELLCRLTNVKSERSIFFKIYQVIIPFALVAFWSFIVFCNSRNRLYRYRTGRSFKYDVGHYHRTFRELCEYFEDADPMAMDIESLPTMKWQDSGGLIFGKIRNKLISFEPSRNGVCAMVWGAPRRREDNINNSNIS